MSELINLHPAFPPMTATFPTTVTRAPLSAPDRALAGDTVEFSSLALARAAGESSLSVVKAAAIRFQIESGVFETPERIEGTVARLLDVIG